MFWNIAIIVLLVLNIFYFIRIIDITKAVKELIEVVAKIQTDSALEALANGGFEIEKEEENGEE